MNTVPTFLDNNNKNINNNNEDSIKNFRSDSLKLLSQNKDTLKKKKTGESCLKKSFTLGDVLFYVALVCTTIGLVFICTFCNISIILSIIFFLVGGLAFFGYNAVAEKCGINPEVNFFINCAIVLIILIFILIFNYMLFFVLIVVFFLYLLCRSLCGV